MTLISPELELDGAPVNAARLAVADPCALTRWALTQLAASADLDCIDVEVTPDNAASVVAAFGVDVLLLDSGARGDAACKLTRELRASFPELGIVIFAADGDDEALFRALDCGASGFVRRSAGVGELLHALRHAASAPATFTASGLAEAMRRRRSAPARPMLTRRELEILTMLRDGHSVPDVAAELYISLSTAKTYVSRVYEKLSAHNRAQALMTAMRLGLITVRTDEVA